VAGEVLLRQTEQLSGLRGVGGISGHLNLIVGGMSNKFKRRLPLATDRSQMKPQKEVVLTAEKKSGKCHAPRVKIYMGNWIQ